MDRINRAVVGDSIKEIVENGDEVWVRLDSGKVLIFSGGYCNEVYVEVKREVVSLENVD